MSTQDDPVNQLIRRRIREIRVSKKLSVRKAASLSEIPESSYSCLENGFYRISLMNLKKILDGLEVKIVDVWPGGSGAAAAAVPAERQDYRTLNFYRFDEVVRISDACRAALLTGERYTEFLFSVNMTAAQKSELVELIEVGLQRNWIMFEAADQEYRLMLCLQDARVDSHLERRISTYLAMWGAARFTQGDNSPV